MWNCILHPPLQSSQQETTPAQNSFHTFMELRFTFSPEESSIRVNYSQKYSPYSCGTVFYAIPSKAFNKRYLQSEIHPLSTWYCIFHSPQQSLQKEIITAKKYIPYPCGTVFYTLHYGTFSIRDNYSKRKYIPYPCGTVFVALPSGAFIKR